MLYQPAAYYDNDIDAVIKRREALKTQSLDLDEQYKKYYAQLLQYSKFFECQHCKTINEIQEKPVILDRALTASISTLILLSISDIIMHSDVYTASDFLINVFQLIFGISMLTSFYIVSNYIFRPRPTREILITNKVFNHLAVYLLCLTALYTALTAAGRVFNTTSYYYPTTDIFRLTVYHIVLLFPISMHAITLFQKIGISSAKLKALQQALLIQDSNINESFHYNPSSEASANIYLYPYTNPQRYFDREYKYLPEKIKYPNKFQIKKTLIKSETKKNIKPAIRQ